MARWGIAALFSLLAALTGLGVRAQAPANVGEADRAAIVDVITRQLDAFNGDRAEEAFGYASPTIRRMFGSAENFVSMVAGGYPAVYRSKSATFIGLETDPGGRLVEKVLIVGPDGVPVQANYFMEKQQDGSWRIDGCVLSRSDDLTA
jgi:hypothetical protein